MLNNRNIKNSILTASLVLFVGVFLPSCIHNYEPVISTISSEPNPVPSGGLVNLVCKANDDDMSSALKTESLNYAWYAAVGQIISENTDNKATWTAPQEPGKYSVSCIVTDEHDGLDIKTVEIVVQ